jgi:energy-coupling factor transporter ATP-binding protein EcfA2
MELGGRPLLGTRTDRPFYLHLPVHDELLRLVHRRTNVLLLGGRGSGKSTLLNQVAGDLERSGVEVVAVDGRLIGDAQAFIGLLAGRFAPRDEEPVSQANLNRLLWSRPDEVAGPLDALDRLAALAGDAQRVVVCDEPPPAVVHTVFGRLRDRLWQLPFTWVVAGSANDEDVYLMPPADAFFERVVRLEDLSPDDGRRLLARRATEFDPATVDALVSARPRTPRELLRRAATLADSEDRDATVRRWADAEARVAALGRPEAMAFAELVALGPVSASDQRLLGRLGWTRERAVQVLGKLERNGFVDSFSERAERGRPRKVFRAKVPG